MLIKILKSYIWEKEEINHNRVKIIFNFPISKI